MAAMSKTIENDILKVFSSTQEISQAISIEELSKKLEHRFPRRTLQRYLAALVKGKKLILSGSGRGSRYQITNNDNKNLTVLSNSSAPKLSPLSQEIRSLIHRPTHEKNKVGYNKKFLYSYKPNKTFYLSSELRNHLTAIGKQPEKKLPAGTYARKIFTRLLIDLSWNSSRLEGNTYSLLETERLLELGETAQGKEAHETHMILNHKAAIELLVEEAKNMTFNRYTLFSIHALLSQNLLSDSSACGRLRTIAVGITGTLFHPLDNPHLIAEYFDKILETALVINDPFEQSFFIMVHLPYLQPFEDVNKRVSRLAANIPLVRGNFSPLSFIDVPQQDYVDAILAIYELNRIELMRDLFVWAYERSCARYSMIQKIIGDPDPFRLRYRTAIADLINHIVCSAMNKKETIPFIQQQSKKLPLEDQSKFIEITETELMSLHEGNIARYKIRPSEYKAWEKVWK